MAGINKNLIPGRINRNPSLTIVDFIPDVPVKLRRWCLCVHQTSNFARWNSCRASECIEQKRMLRAISRFSFHHLKSRIGIAIDVFVNELENGSLQKLSFLDGIC